MPGALLQLAGAHLTRLGCRLPIARVPQHDTRCVDLMDLLYLHRCLHTHARSHLTAWVVSEVELRPQQHLSQHLFHQLHEGAAGNWYLLLTLCGDTKHSRDSLVPAAR